MKGIAERRLSDGRTAYRVRVRRGGHVESRTFATMERALAWRAAALDALARGETPEPAPPRLTATEPPGRSVTVEDAARRLVRGMRDGSVRTNRGREYKPSVTRKYEEQLRLLVLPRIGAVPVVAVTTGDVQRLVDEIAAEKSPEHARKALTALRVALRLAARYGEVDASPCSGVRLMVDDADERDARILTPEEVAAIVSAAEADDERLRRSFGAPLIALAAATGLRLGELLALPWGVDGLDLDASVVRVRRSLDRVRDVDGRYPYVAPKSDAGRRDVPIPAEDVARLRRHRLASGRRDGDLVFGDPRTGEALSPTPGLRGFQRACFRAGVFADGADDVVRAAESYDAFRRACRERGITEPLPRFHDLRHAFATHALAAGLSAHAVARLIGHSDPGLVWKRYGHPLPAELAGAGDALSAFRRAQGV